MSQLIACRKAITEDAAPDALFLRTRRGGGGVSRIYAKIFSLSETHVACISDMKSSRTSSRNAQSAISKWGSALRLTGLSLLVLFGMALVGNAYACAPASNVYGYSYGGCSYKSLEEAEVAMHATVPGQELAFPIPGDFDFYNNNISPPLLDYRPYGASGSSASVLIEPALTTSTTFSLFVKAWPPTDTACQVLGCTAGQGCTSLAAEKSRAQCEFQATWNVANSPYCWSFTYVGDNGLPFSQTPSLVNHGSFGSFNYTPSSSQDYSSLSVQIGAITGCGSNTSGTGVTARAQAPLLQPPFQTLATQSSQSFQWPVLKKNNFTCQLNAAVNPAASSTNDACQVTFSKIIVTPPTFLEPPDMCGYGNPCFPASGNKEAHEKGFHYGEIAFDLHYNSLRQTRPFGYIDRNWSHSFAKRLLTPWISTGGEIADPSPTTTNPSAIYVQDEEAHLELFRQDPTTPTLFRSTATVGNMLHYFPAVGTTTASSWNLYRTNGTVDVFDPAGRLTQIITLDDPKKTLTLSYLGLPITPLTATQASDQSHWSEAFWRLSTVTDGNGRFISFSYDNSAQMWLTSITADDGVTALMSFGYDANSDGVHRLTSTTQFGMKRQYLYNEPANIYVTNPPSTPPAGIVGYWLTGIIDEQGNRFATYQYDDWGRVVASWHGLEQAGIVTVTYPSIGSVPDDAHSTVTLPLGNTKTFTYSSTEPFRHPQQVVDGSGTTQYQYSPTTRRKTQTIDPNGNTTKLEYDANGYHEIARTEGYGTAQQRRTETDWDPGTNRVLALRIYADPSGGPRTLETTTSYAYGPTTGHLKTITQTSPGGGNPRVWTYTYCAGNTSGCLTNYLQKIDGPRTDVTDTTTYTYYTSTLANTYRTGDLNTITNATGQVTTFSQYNARGQVMEEIDPNGVRTDFTHTPRGWLQSSTVRANATGTSPADATTSFAYDPVGNVTEVTLPDASYQYFVYDDAERLTDVYDSTTPATPLSGNRIHYTLDADGHRLIENTINPANVTTRKLFRTFDALSHLQQLQDASRHPTLSFNAINDPTPGAVRGYDGNGNPTHFQDGLGTQTEKSYDALNRLKSTIEDYLGSDAAANTSTQYTYDARDNLRSVTDPNSLVTVYTYDGLNNLTVLSSPDTGNSTYLYDTAGNRIQKTDARGVVSTYAYDALNRIIGVSYPTASLNVTYAYDTVNAECTAAAATFAKGRLTKMVDASGQTTYCYDGHGNLRLKTQVTNARTFITSYGYTAADRLAAITYPSGAIVTYGRDNVGRIVSVSYKANATAAAVSLVNNATYYPFGPLNTIPFGNGRTLTKTYDTNYGIDRVASSVAGGLTLDFSLDVMGNIQNASNTLNATPPTQQYQLDPLYRLKEVDNGASLALQEGFTYNKTGDRLSKSESGQAIQNYLYSDPTSHHLSGGRTYDQNGNLASLGSKVGGSFHGRSYSFDDTNRYVATNTLGTTIGSDNEYIYNGRGERVRKTGYNHSVGSIDISYVYDQAGTLIGEYPINNSGTVQPPTEYIYLDRLPVGVVANGVLNYIETDHLGTPRKVIQPGATDTVVWNWDFFGSAFGENPPTGALTFNLRYPGQYYDQETGLNYNSARDYEPGTGRYIESDPVGLEGGLSTYSYANGDPLDAVDPSGLSHFFPGCNSGGCHAPAPAPGPWSPNPGGSAPSRPNLGGAFMDATLTLYRLCNPHRGCPPCKLLDGTEVQPGQISYRYDRLPATTIQHGIAGDHLNLYKANQNPNNCKCFWQPQDTVSPPPQPGWIPIQPFLNAD